MSTPADQQRDRLRLGLLEYLGQHTVDDYEAAAQSRRVSSDRPSRFRPGAVAAVAAFAMLLVVAGLQASRDAGTDQYSRAQLIEQVTARRDTLTQRRRSIAELTRRTRALQQDFLARGHGTGVFARLRTLSALTGAASVTGPGVRVLVDDAPDSRSDKTRVLDRDLQGLVNALWESGAEAISINGIRLTTLSAIRSASEAITVDYTSISRPYVVRAIGDKDQIPARFAQTGSGAAWYTLKTQFGLRFEMRTADSLRIPASGSLPLRYATVGKEKKN